MLVENWPYRSFTSVRIIKYRTILAGSGNAVDAHVLLVCAASNGKVPFVDNYADYVEFHAHQMNGVDKYLSKGSRYFVILFRSRLHLY